MKKKVLIVDDSALIREILTSIIGSLEEFEVVGIAIDPHMAAEKIMSLKPDIITLDIEMPKMDGITFLEKLMRMRPMPVLIISSLSERNSDITLAALELGAVDYVTKPKNNIRELLPILKEEIHQKLLACAEALVHPLLKRKIGDGAKKVLSKGFSSQFQTTDKVIAIGASTGGTVALSKLLSSLPVNLPGILVVQHMPSGFTKSFAERLNSECELLVKEAENNDTVLPGQVLIAPGDYHLTLERSGTRYFARVERGEMVSHHRPSVEVLFHSVAKIAGANAVGIMLTGMGDDGASAMLEMKKAGAFNIAQSEKSCTVFGMPKAAIEKQAIDSVLDLEAIATALLRYKI